MAREVPALEKRDGWQESLDEFDALGSPRAWLLIGPLPNANRKQFETPSGPDRTDDWTAFHTVRWARPNDEEGCEVDLAELLGRGRDVMACAQTEVEWPVEGPALLWFDTPGRAVVYLNNAEVESLQPHRRSSVDGGRESLYPIPVQMRLGRNIVKVKIGTTDDRKAGFDFHLRLERNDTPWREQLFAKLRELYPDEAAGWRGAEALLELARRYETMTRFQDALAACQKVSDGWPDNEDYLVEIQEARRRMLTPRDVGRDPQSRGAETWKAVEAQFRTLLQDAETLRADRLLRDFIARCPASPNTGAALCWRGALRQDYALSRECRPFFERAVREFGRDETVRKYAVRGIAYARQARPETPEVAVKFDVQLLVDAARRQISAGNPADIAAALRSYDSILRTSGDALLRISDSPFAPRYAGVREYVRALLGHLAGEPLAQYRTSMARAAEQQFQQARSLGSIVDLEAAAWECYYTPGAAKALNQVGNLYMDRGSFSQAAAVFKLLLRDYRDSPAAPSAAPPDDRAGGTGLLGGLSEPLIMLKLARALLMDGQPNAAREVAGQLHALHGAKQLKIGGRIVTAGDRAQTLQAGIAWKTLGAVSAGVNAETETLAGNTRRTGSPPAAPAPKPVAATVGGTLSPASVAWSSNLPKSSVLATALRYWNHEDKTYLHWESHPVAAGNRVVVSTLEGLWSVDLQTGQLLWNQTWNSSGGLLRDKFTGFPVSCPTAKNDRIYLRALGGAQTSLRCYHADNGKLQWSTEAIPALKKTVWLSDPLVAYGLVMAVFLEGPPQAADGGRNTPNIHGVAAFDADTGDLRWKRTLAKGSAGMMVCEEIRGRDNRQYAVYRGVMQLGPPAADGGVVYAPTGLASLAALNAFTGEVLWLAGYAKLRSEDLQMGTSGSAPFVPRILKLNARGPVSPIVGDDVVVLAPKDAAGVIAFDRRNGEIRWRQDLLDCRYLAGVCEGNVLAADNTVTALSLATGKVAWEYTVGAAGAPPATGGDARGTTNVPFVAGSRLLGQPGYSGAVLYLPTQANLQLVDARTGQPLAAFPWDQKVGPLGNLLIGGQRIIGVNGRVLAALAAK